MRSTHPPHLLGARYQIASKLPPTIPMSDGQDISCAAGLRNHTAYAPGVSPNWALKAEMKVLTLS